MGNIKHKMGNKLANLSEHIKELNKRNHPDAIRKNLEATFEKTKKIQKHIQEFSFVDMVEKPKPIKHKFSFNNPNILKSELLQFIRINPNDDYMKKYLKILTDWILPLAMITILFFDIKSDGDGSFLKGLEKMTSDVVFWYIILALIIFAPIAILFAKKLEKNNKN